MQKRKVIQYKNERREYARKIRHLSLPVSILKLKYVANLFFDGGARD